MSKRTIILIILDGWGIGRNDQSNPIFTANPQNIAYLKANFPFASLQASGIAVGLPWGEEGNSEVGHLTIGAGKVLYQNYPRITIAIRDESFFQNEVIKNAFEHSKKNNSAVNLIGLLSSGNVHSSIDHLEALLKFAEMEKVSKINLHLITDGRDSPPQSSLELFKKFNSVNIASVSGRYYAMDREKHWDRTKAYYQTLTGEGVIIDNIENHINKIHQKGLSDEYILPAMFTSTDSEKRFIKDGDSVLFFNFREDRMKQIVEPFTDKSFDKFPTKQFSNLYISSLVNYDNKFTIPVAFPQEKIENPLSKILAENAKTQLKIAETEKYTHITYFFNGQIEPPFQNEYRVLIPSKSVIHHDEHPEMMANEITGRVIQAIEERTYDFIMANYANPDTIAHTGNYEACVKAVKIIDEQIGKITKAVLGQNNTALIITSDHGNVERLFDPQTGQIETQHDASPVPIHLVAREFQKLKNESDIKIAERETIGILSDIAPTILDLMRISKPKEMTGESLVKLLV